MPCERKLSDRQIAFYAIHVGFPERGLSGRDDAQIAVAVALAESGGCADELGDTKPDAHGLLCNSHGLWQIRSCPESSDPRRLDRGTRAWLIVPNNNAQRAYELYRARGGRFTDWSAYLNGSYQAFMPRASTAVMVQRQNGNQPPPDPAGNITGGDVLGGLGDTAGGIVNAITSVPQFLSLLTKGATWVRVGEFIGGAVLLFMAAYLIAKRLGYELPAPGAVAKAAAVLA